MNKLLFDILDGLNEGIIILDQNMQIKHFNHYIKQLATFDQQEILGSSIVKIFPNLDKRCYRDALHDVLEKGIVRFFSAAMHKSLISNEDHFNLKISRLEFDGNYSLLLELINVTGQMNQINQLKTYVAELLEANEELIEKEKTIRNLAYYDKLTGVANRALFYERADALLATAKKDHSLLGLLFLDIDKFKCINDTYGHEIGDKILTQVTSILLSCTRENDIVARYGGDEFLILLPEISSIQDCYSIAAAINNFEQKELVVNNNKIPISLSIGASCFPQDGDAIDTLIAKADTAMYVVKRKSKDIC